MVIVSHNRTSQSELLHFIAFIITPSPSVSWHKTFNRCTHMQLWCCYYLLKALVTIWMFCIKGGLWPNGSERQVQTLGPRMATGLWFRCQKYLVPHSLSVNKVSQWLGVRESAPLSTTTQLSCLPPHQWATTFNNAICLFAWSQLIYLLCNFRI